MRHGQELLQIGAGVATPRSIGLIRKLYRQSFESYN